ncbi:hypothetical protein ColKHC_14009 [Colletotrichum higginsianum]|nr:hypothetical protein ColKHC_14009 [Colletotrichum higginsianum]
MNSVRELMFSYNMENRIRTSSDKIRRFDGSLETSSHQGLVELLVLLVHGAAEPDTSTNFPEGLKFLLSIRSCARSYRDDGGVVSIDGDCPENSLLEAPPGQIYDVSGSSNLVICEYEYKYLDVSTVAHSLEKHKSAITNDSEANDSYQNEVKPVIPYTKYMMQCSVVYKDNAPLSVYTNIAVSEAIYYSSGSEFWKTMYKPLETITCAYTTPVRDGDDDRTEIADEDHRPDPCHRGFLDPYYTPQSKAAGKVRIFCTGVCVRIMATRIIEIAQDIMSSCSGLL